MDNRCPWTINIRPTLRPSDASLIIPIFCCLILCAVTFRDFCLSLFLSLHKCNIYRIHYILLPDFMYFISTTHAMTIRDFCRSFFLTLHYYNIYIILLHDNLLSVLVSSTSTIQTMQPSTSRTKVATITNY